jgi:MerR family transcriptional regulator, light-induced transcriptional regulator
MSVEQVLTKGKDAVRDKYFIKDLESITGIKAHTLRIWEQRYKIIVPKRTETNIRYYDDDDLRFILNISVLNKQGYKISKIAEMPRQELLNLCQKLAAKDQDKNQLIQELVMAMIAFDEKEFNKIIAVYILKHGLEQTIIKLIFPFLEQCGVLWIVGTIQPAHEHFISNLIRQKLFVSIDNLTGIESKNMHKFLLFVPLGEEHDIGILFANYLLRSKGHKVIYLGSSLPFEELYSIFKVHKPDFIFSTVTSINSNVKIQYFVDTLSAGFPQSQILLSGSQILGKTDLKIPSNVKLIRNPKEFIDFLEKL